MLIGAKAIIKKTKPLVFLSYHPFHIKKLGYDKSFIFDILRELDYKIYDSKKKTTVNFKEFRVLTYTQKKKLK